MVARRSSWAGQQRVRSVWANIGAFYLCLWTITMTEAWAWGARGAGALVDWSSLDMGAARPVDRATPTRDGSGVARRWTRRFERSAAPGAKEAESRVTVGRLLSRAA